MGSHRPEEDKKRTECSIYENKTRNLAHPDSFVFISQSCHPISYLKGLKKSHPKLWELVCGHRDKRSTQIPPAENDNLYIIVQPEQGIFFFLHWKILILRAYKAIKSTYKDSKIPYYQFLSVIQHLATKHFSLQTKYNS